MKIRQLVSQWQNTSSDTSPKIRMQVEISTYNAARLAALADLFPSVRSEDILAELLHAALNEVEEAFPYVKGKKQVGEDELGNPIYEDAGFTPRFLALLQEHRRKLEQK